MEHDRRIFNRQAILIYVFSVRTPTGRDAALRRPRTRAAGVTDWPASRSSPLQSRWIWTAIPTLNAHRNLHHSQNLWSAQTVKSSGGAGRPRLGNLYRIVPDLRQDVCQRVPLIARQRFAVLNFVGSAGRSLEFQMNSVGGTQRLDFQAARCVQRMCPGKILL